MRRFIIPVVLLACIYAPAAAEDYPADAFPLRNHNPFLQVFGLPAFQTAELVVPGQFEFTVSYDTVNDAEEADRLDEILIIDVESQVLNFSLRRRIGERFELGIDVPFVRHSEGYLDSVIYDFHDLVGFSNSTREGPEDQYRLFYEQQGQVLFDSSSPTSGVGDIQISAAMQLGRATLRAGLKAPTGDPDKLTGSGAADLSLGVYGGGMTTMFARQLAFSGFVGVLALGDGDVLSGIQRSVVPYGGAALRWHATSRFALATQLYAQGSYFDARLDELGANTLQLAFGGDYRFPEQRLLLRVAIVEDIATAAAPDFAFHLSIRRYSY